MSVSIISPQLSSKNAKDYAAIVVKGVQAHPALSALADIVNIKHLTKQIIEHLNPSLKFIKKITGFKPRRIVYLRQCGKRQPESLFILWNRKKEIETIGKGSSAKCVFASRVSDGKLVAALIRTVDKKSEKQIFIEKEIVDKAHECPEVKEFLVPSYGYADYKNKKGIKKVAIIQEYMDKGTLDKRKVKLSFEQKIEFGIKLFTGINNLHKLSISPRDIKSDNILISQDSNGEYVPVINDFDSASSFTDTEEDLQSIKGTPHFLKPGTIARYESRESMTPEDLKAQDIWASAIVLYYLIYNKDLPWLYFIDTLGDQVRANRTQTLIKIKKAISEYLTKVNWNTSNEKRLNELFKGIFTNEITSADEIIKVLMDIKSKPDLKQTQTLKRIKKPEEPMEVK